MVLFYADVLGMKQRWQTGDIDTVKDAYQALETAVSEALGETKPVHDVSGGVQSDAVALVFDDVVDAVRFGTRLFLNAFQAGDDASRFWLRGIVTPCDTPAADLIAEHDLPATEAAVRARHFCDELLNAVVLEQAFKGPRLLISESAVTKDLQDALAVKLGDLHVVPLRNLTYASTPDVGGTWWDVLYLLPDPLEPVTVDERRREVSCRMRWASSRDHGGSREELTHVAMLDVVWAECESIAWAVGLRAGEFPVATPA